MFQEVKTSLVQNGVRTRRNLHLTIVFITPKFSFINCHTRKKKIPDSKMFDRLKNKKFTFFENSVNLYFPIRKYQTEIFY